MCELCPSILLSITLVKTITLVLFKHFYYQVDAENVNAATNDDNWDVSGVMEQANNGVSKTM